MEVFITGLYAFFAILNRNFAKNAIFARAKLLPAIFANCKIGNFLSISKSTDLLSAKEKFS